MANNYTPQQIEEILQMFFDVAGTRQYIGARYVPIFGRGRGTSVDWDNSDAYEPLSIVYYQGDTYTSRRYVPSGIAIDNQDYWVITGRYNAQVEQYRQEVLSFQGQIDEANAAIDTLRSDVAADYVPFPDSGHYPKYGTTGQVLTTLSNGDTKWEDPVVPSDEQAEQVITTWLDEHPEATTTVLDGSITTAKLADGSVTTPKLADDSVTDGKLSQNGGILSTIKNMYSIDYSKNVVNPANIGVGGLNSDGSVDTTLNSSISEFIEAPKNTTLYFTTWGSSNRNTNRKSIALYDANKKYIESSYQSVSGQYIVSFNTGNAAYFRVSGMYTTNLMVNTDSVSTTFNTYANPYKTDMKVNNYEDNSVKESSIDATFKESIIFKEIIDLIGTTIVGVLYQDSGNINSSATNYRTTDFITIKNGYKYIAGPQCRKMCIYSTPSASGYVDGFDVNPASTYEYTASSDCYMRISFEEQYANDMTIKEYYVGTPENKIEEGVELSNTMLSQVNDIVQSYPTSILNGKKWAVCGDSFTNSGGTGTLMPSGTKYAGRPYTYPWIIGSRANMEIVKFFEGGRTLAFPETPGTFTNSLTNPDATWYYQNIPSDADYITIYLGINDEHHSSGGGDDEDPTGYIPLGTINDNTTASYLGAWNVVLTWLITNRPNAHIGIIVTNGNEGNDNYRLGQIAIAEKYGIPYIDMNGDARTPAMIRTSNPNIPAAVKDALIAKWRVSPTNTHPNDAAQLFESTFIEAFLMSL